jgi:hypothetical protein
LIIIGNTLPTCEISGSHALMMEALRTSETSVYFNETTRRCILGGCSLQLITHTRIVLLVNSSQEAMQWQGSTFQTTGIAAQWETELLFQQKVLLRDINILFTSRRSQWSHMLKFAYFIYLFRGIFNDVVDTPDYIKTLHFKTQPKFHFVILQYKKKTQFI